VCAPSRSATRHNTLRLVRDCTQAKFGRRLREAAAELGICPTVRLAGSLRSVALLDALPNMSERARDAHCAFPLILRKAYHALGHGGRSGRRTRQSALPGLRTCTSLLGARAQPDAHSACHADTEARMPAPRHRAVAAPAARQSEIQAPSHGCPGLRRPVCSPPHTGCVSRLDRHDLQG